jgi:hypothetical protein
MLHDIPKALLNPTPNTLLLSGQVNKFHDTTPFNYLEDIQNDRTRGKVNQPALWRKTTIFKLACRGMAGMMTRQHLPGTAYDKMRSWCTGGGLIPVLFIEGVGQNIPVMPGLFASAQQEPSKYCARNQYQGGAEIGG